MIKLSNIEKNFDGRNILSNMTLEIAKGEFVAITGDSGSGKTTLLNIMGLLEKPDKGTVEIIGIKDPDEKKIMELRRYGIGYVFQNYVLMNNETVERNLLVSKKYSKTFSKQLMIDTLIRVGLDATYLSKKVYQLSGGEQQRVSIARVMLKPCEVIFADEPTGNLDEDNKRVVLSLFKEMKEEGKTIVCVTHDYEIAESADRVISLNNTEYDLRVVKKDAL